MKEIEVKIKLKEKTSFDDAINIIKNKYDFLPSVKIQEDTIYLFPEQVDKPIVAGSKIVRLRTVKEGGSIKNILTLKVQTDKPLVSDEYEFEVFDPIITERFLINLGLKENVKVRKERVEIDVNDTTLCIDKVDKIGVFVEMEKMIKDDQNIDIIALQAEMVNFLRSLGLEGEINMIPYDTQVKLYNKEKRD